MEERVTSVFVVKEGAALFDITATEISIKDDGSGEFVCVIQNPDTGPEEIRIEPSEWPLLRGAIDKMIAECREET